MKRFCFEFITTDGEGKTFITIAADEIDHRDGYIVAWRGESVVAVINLSLLKCCYIEEGSESE